MAKRGPIIIAEDDEDEREILLQAFKNLSVRNEIKFFDNGQQLLNYLTETTDKPFLIISDINLPVMNGLELRARIDKNAYLRHKSIPFIFMSTNSNSESVKKAYDMMVQGYFIKESSIKEIEKCLGCIIEYWGKCKHPNE